MMMLGVTLKLFDQMSGGLGGIAAKVEGLRGKFERLADTAGKLGRGALGSGLVAGGSLLKTVSAFADLEDASTRLKVTMMDKNGLTGAFDQVNALAVKLGNELPGTSADFLNMMATLKQFGITDQSILGGVGEATAKIAVLMKMMPSEAAEFAAKLKEATGVADSDMLAFMDTLQRTYHQGVSATEMMYAFARSGGALKAVKQQGLEASQSLSALYAIWIKGGLSGETVGTGMGTILNSVLDKKKISEANAALQGAGIKPMQFTDAKGNFKGIENMVIQFEKLKALDPVRMNAVLKTIFGGGQDQQMVATLVSNGLNGYRKMVADLERQASLQKRVNEQLGTLKNLWDAASGTFVNTIAGFAEAMGGDLKALTEWFGAASQSIGEFIKQHPVLVQWLGRIALAFTGIAIGGGSVLLAVAGVSRFIALAIPIVNGLGVALSFLGTVFSVIGRAFLFNPIGLAITALAVAALLIYKNWAPIKQFFIDLWAGIKNAFTDAVEWIRTKTQDLSNLMPDWMKNYTIPGQVVKFAAEQMGPPRAPATNAQPGQASVNGVITVKVEGKAKSVRATSKTPGVGLNVDAGPLTVGH